jgi:hypothetical protein
MPENAQNDPLLDRFIDAVRSWNEAYPKRRLSANRIAREVSALAGHYVADVTIRSWLARIRRPTAQYREALERYVNQLSNST